MSELVDHLAELTGFRDRDILDVTLVGALRDLLRPRVVTIYRSVGDAGQERWITRARLGENDAVATADPVWADVESLPPLSLYPERLQAMKGQATVVTVPGRHSLSLFPVSTDREVVGVMEIETLDPLSDESRRLVGSILRIYRNFQALLDYSERDTLTGLLNRKTFDESFLKATNEQSGMPSMADGRRHAAVSHRHWLGVIDIDHFKRVNDTYGHLIGDEVLLLLSRLMRSSFRFHDRLYRFGGEEFVVLMRCDNEQDAALALERMRSNTASYPFPQVGQITISIGFTEVKPGDTPSAAFERADKAVYFAKSHGRNQVQSHAELIARGDLEDESKIGDVELF
ncbi:MAG: GGDEF domain-containing protein [Rhizobacter sp.]